MPASASTASGRSPSTTSDLRPGGDGAPPAAEPFEPSAAEPLALYVHWPFCLSKCPYCDFNSHVRDGVDAGRFGRALLAELRSEALRLGPRPLGSIFFGGGTPSLMEPALVGAVIEAARALFPARTDLEVTLEANPTSVEAGRLAAFRDAGVDRCSLGVQALDDAALAALGRGHSAAEALAALELARRIFPRLSFDLIFARPGQDEQAWRSELARALDLASEHLSLYQLTIEPGTRYAALHRRGRIVLPDDDHAARLLDATEAMAGARGLRAYEVSNYARPGAESRHNLAYWTYADHAGIGPGAHGRTADAAGAMRAVRRRRSPERWLAAVERDGHAIEEEEVIGARDRGREMLIMGLRLARGVEAARFARRTGIALDDALERPVLEAAVEAGYLRYRDGVLAATAQGRRRLDQLLPRLLA